jgi:hypothetical protein
VRAAYTPCALCTYLLNTFVELAATDELTHNRCDSAILAHVSSIFHSFKLDKFRVLAIILFVLPLMTMVYGMVLLKLQAKRDSKKYAKIRSKQRWKQLGVEAKAYAKLAGDCASDDQEVGTDEPVPKKKRCCGVFQRKKLYEEDPSKTRHHHHADRGDGLLKVRSANQAPAENEPRADTAAQQATAVKLQPLAAVPALPQDQDEKPPSRFGAPPRKPPRNLPILALSAGTCRAPVGVDNGCVVAPRPPAASRRHSPAR